MTNTSQHQLLDSLELSMHCNEDKENTILGASSLYYEPKTIVTLGDHTRVLEERKDTLAADEDELEAHSEFLLAAESEELIDPYD